MIAPEDERLVRYLLDESPEHERAAVERELLADEERFEEAVAVEDELRHDYLRGLLTPERRARFEARLLRTEDDTARLERARAFLAALDRAGSGPATQPASSSRAWWPAAAALAGLALAGAVVELVRTRAQLDDLVAQRSAADADWARRATTEKERADGLARDLRAEHERRTLLESELAARSGTAAARSVVALALAPGLVRGEDARIVRLAPATDDLRLTLRLPGGETGRLQASLRDAEGREVWFRGLVQPRGSAAAREVVLSVPARLLPAGEYEVLLRTASTAPEEIADYHFVVTTPAPVR